MLLGVKVEEVKKPGVAEWADEIAQGEFKCGEG